VFNDHIMKNYTILHLISLATARAKLTYQLQLLISQSHSHK
jgi:hypothetical protein